MRLKIMVLSFLILLSMISFTMNSTYAESANSSQEFQLLNGAISVEIVSGWKLDEKSDLLLEFTKEEDDSYWHILLEHKEDYVHQGAKAHKADTHNNFSKNLSNYQTSPITNVKVDGLDAYESEVSGAYKGIVYKYHSVILEHDQYYVELLGWSKKSKYDRLKNDYTKFVSSLKFRK